MKRKLFKTLTSAVVAIAAMVGVSSCQDPNKGPGDEIVDGISVSAVTPSFNSVTFSVNADPAVAVAYLCVPQGESRTAKEIFETGTASGTIKGEFTVSNLKSDTDYTLLVAKRNKSLEGPSKVNFRTKENDGTPPTTKSAGIRVDEVDKSNVIFEVLNGEETDYSYIGVWPYVYIENYLFEAEKAGISREQYLTDLILGYPYLCAKAVGRGKATKFDYMNDFNSEAATSKLWPAADYMVVSLGMQGDLDENGKDGEPGNIVMKRFRTGNFEIEGKPAIVIDTMYTDYIRVRYNFLPGVDAACFAFTATKKSEIDEFVNHYDDSLGAGQGVAMLKEYVRFIDPYVADHTQAMEYTVTYGFDQSGIDFEALAVPMDRNLMTGEMARRVDQVRTTPTNQVDADFTWTLDPDGEGFGATNFWYSVRFGKNCANIYWRLTTQAEYDAEIAKIGEKMYARDLWNQGWGEDRPMGSNPNKDKEHYEKNFRWGEVASKDYIVVASALNYTGGISLPKVVGKFRSKNVIFEGGPAEPQVNIEVETVGKTSALLRYYVPEGVDKNVPRVIRHIILEENDPLWEMSDRDIKDMLYLGKKINDDYTIQGNEWSVYSIDEADAANPYDWQWNWTGMKPGTKYINVWLTEDVNGFFSEIKKVNFQTARNDGGPNPRMNITVDPSTILTNADDNKKWGFKAKFIPNSDVVHFSILFIDRFALESHDYSAATKAELEEGLKALLLDQGMTNCIEVMSSENYGNPKGYQVWPVTISFGAADVQGALTYLEVKEDGTIGQLVESAIPASFSAKMQRMAPLRGLAELKARSDRARANTPALVDVAPPFAAGEPQAYDQMAPQKGEIKVRSMKEITLDVLTRGNYKNQ